MFEAVLPIWRFCLHRENWRRNGPAPSIRHRKEDDPTALHEYGHWLDQDTLAGFRGAGKRTAAAWLTSPKLMLVTNGVAIDRARRRRTSKLD